MNCANAGSQVLSPHEPDKPGPPDLFLDLEPEVEETAAEGLPLRGSQMDAILRGPDGSGKCDLFLSFSPSVSYRQHPSEVHARAAYGVMTLLVGKISAYLPTQATEAPYLPPNLLANIFVRRYMGMNTI